MRQLTTQEMEALANWQTLANQLETLKPREMEARKAVANMLVPNSSPGTHRYDIRQGYSAKVAFSETHSLDKSRLSEMPTVAKELAEAGLTNEEISALIVTEYKLVGSAYAKLSAKHQQIMSRIVITKIGAPSLEIAAPKPEKV